MALRDSPFEARPGVAGDGSVTLALSGELDLSIAAALGDQLDGIRAGRPRQVIFDMSRVSYADLGTLRALVTGQGGGPDALRPVLCHPPPVVVRLLAVSGLAEHCVIVPRPPPGGARPGGLPAVHRRSGRQPAQRRG